MSLRLKLVIDGKLVEGKDSKDFPVYNPYTREVMGHSARAFPEDVDAAVKAARKAFPSWSTQTAGYREAVLLKVADLMEQRKDQLVDILIDESGSTYQKSMFEITYGASIIRSAAGEARRLYGDTFPNDKSHRMSIVVREPIGVVVAISPFNGPLLLFIKMTVFALAAGNTVVAKPSEETPLIGLKFGELLLDAGVPPGVFNVVSGFGPDCGSILVAHPDVNGVAFTGSTPTGERIASVAAPHMKHLQLELGGKNPLVILKDYDPVKAANISAAAFYHSGQICMASTRVIVERPIFESFCQHLKVKLESLPLGDPRDPKTAYGPLINQNAVNKCLKHVEEAVAAGCKILTGGKVKEGYIFEPTVIIEPPRSHGVWREETFGPVVSIVVVDNEEQALKEANDSDFGLSAGVLTNNLQLGLNLARQINCGAVHVGTHSFQSDTMAPVGGVKKSGFGKSGGKYSVDHFTKLKWISIELGETPLPF